MAIVAVAGGNGGIGRALVDAITKRGKHSVMILSRKADNLLAKQIGVPVLAVDYADVDSLTRMLEENCVDTVLSALFTMPMVGVPPEVNLIRAAQALRTTRRFLPSNWGVPLDENHQAMAPSVPVKLAASDELSKSDLEHTVFYPGFLLDYYTGPSIKSYMSPLVVVIDMEHNVAAIPGSGNVPVVFTHSLDIGRYVDAALDLKSWDPFYTIIGNKITLNDFVQAAQDAKGTSFQIVHDSVEDLREGKVTLLPATQKYLHLMSVPDEATHSKFLATFGQLFDDGTFDLAGERALNMAFPEIKPLTVQEAVAAAAMSSTLYDESVM